jgi:hypothetical protein
MTAAEFEQKEAKDAKSGGIALNAGYQNREQEETEPTEGLFE